MGTQAGKVLKSVTVYFLGLDAAMSIPIVIFIPGYLMAKVVYGADVTKELMPLSIIGPVIVAFYVKIIQGLCSIYLFFVMQASKLIKNPPRTLDWDQEFKYWSWRPKELAWMSPPQSNSSSPGPG
ncbi:hypothetical protein OPV22_021716 [Ensete ventricosum]|uniref:ABC transmembrane type-1 domain-containing protein n=1 Tax=Ensete ventricosum TaxID=4639 RepID=A0AAV8QMN4_ENSVE|nr:hypothetical protein OPV22_021716 [Ensete ventricosum]